MTNWGVVLANIIGSLPVTDIFFDHIYLFISVIFSVIVNSIVYLAVLFNLKYQIYEYNKPSTYAT